MSVDGIRNLSHIRERDPRLYEALTDIVSRVSAVASQVNGSGTTQPSPPPAIGGLHVTGQNGHFSIAIQDDSPLYRDVHYYVEHADNPQFTNPQVIHLGHTRNHSIFLGNVTRYWRAYSSYASSPPGSPAYYGTAQVPTPVTGGGSIAGPNFTASQGSGTGPARQGLQGPGVQAYRSANGAPPVR